MKKKPNTRHSTVLKIISVHALMKQKKTKTEYLRGHSVFVHIVIKLGPFKKSLFS